MLPVTTGSSQTLSVYLLKCSSRAFFFETGEATHTIILFNIHSTSSLWPYFLQESSLSVILYSKALAVSLYLENLLGALDCFTVFFEPTLPALLPWTPDSKVTWDGGSVATGAKGIGTSGQPVPNVVIDS